MGEGETEAGEGRCGAAGALPASPRRNGLSRCPQKTLRPAGPSPQGQFALSWVPPPAAGTWLAALIVSMEMIFRQGLPISLSFHFTGQGVTVMSPALPTRQALPQMNTAFSSPDTLLN